ncbi:hypothetical protein [Deinococcus sp. Leaf326]|uniref:hypothetical protein n=1 Tax=Deinococcus sp. Leaf326 TaxID=1736338 RepID=UPI0006FB3E84|nr:hypothetical protein [Deinococcus sp. Leaf326]KQR33115.1 hypothetical protein ASF71_16625 [Deinococcus sp. Leaf326]
MNITAGQGGSAWRPRRLYFEAHDAPSFGVPDEKFDATAIEVSLSFGPLGTLRSGNLGLATLPAVWETRAWPRMIRARLESEHGTGYIAGAIAEAAIRQRGELSGVPLTGIESAFLGRPGTGAGAALDGAGLTPGGTRAFGVAMPTATAEQTREEAVNTALEPYPNSEAGVSADLAGIIGRPEGATPALYTVDHRAYGFRNLGWSVTDYVSDARLSADDGWPARTFSRSDVPPFAPRRLGEATVEPRTLSVPHVFMPPPYESGLDLRYPMTGAGRRWIINPQFDILTQQGRVQEVFVEITMNVEVDSAPIEVTLLLSAPGMPMISAPVTYKASGVYQQRWQVPLEVAMTPQLSASIQALGTSGYFTLQRFAATSTLGIENVAGIVMPYGWAAPFAIGPTYEFSLPGVHVPPFLITVPEALCGIVGGVTQHAAGAVVTWSRGEASTKILTAALPYAGQKRGAA